MFFHVRELNMISGALNPQIISHPSHMIPPLPLSQCKWTFDSFIQWKVKLCISRLFNLENGVLEMFSPWFWGKFSEIIWTKHNFTWVSVRYGIFMSLVSTFIGKYHWWPSVTHGFFTNKCALSCQENTMFHSSNVRISIDWCRVNIAVRYPLSVVDDLFEIIIITHPHIMTIY